MTQEGGVPLDFWGRIQKMIEDAVAKLARSGMLRNASITGGGLTIKGGFLRVLFPQSNGGGTGVYFGDLVAEGTGEYLGTGLLVQGESDEVNIAEFRTTSSGGTRAVIYTDNDKPAVSTATVGVGLARPYLTGGFARARFADWGVSTSSASFETLFEQAVDKQHPNLLVAIRACTDGSSVTGETRVLVDGVQLGDVSAEEFVANYRYFGPTAVAGAHMESLAIQIQGRVTSGSGALRVEARYWRGSGS